MTTVRLLMALTWTLWSAGSAAPWAPSAAPREALTTDLFAGRGLPEVVLVDDDGPDAMTLSDDGSNALLAQLRGHGEGLQDAILRLASTTDVSAAPLARRRGNFLAATPNDNSKAATARNAGAPRPVIDDKVQAASPGEAEAPEAPWSVFGPGGQLLPRHRGSSVGTKALYRGVALMQEHRAAGDSPTKFSLMSFPEVMD